MPCVTIISFSLGKEISCVLLKHENNGISGSCFEVCFFLALPGIYCYISLEPVRQHMAHSNNVIEVDLTKGQFIKMKAGLVD